MTNNIDQNFLDEASDLLQAIEETLIGLLEEKTIDRVHSLMRSAHTLKGSAAYLQLETVESIAHELETVFQSLYPEELEIDPELSSLLLDGYECLRTPLAAILSHSSYDEEAIKTHAENVFSQLKTKLGDYYTSPQPPPTSEELGFDVLGSIIADSLPQDLANLQTSIEAGNAEKTRELCQTEAEFLLELAISYELPGLGEIARSTLTALELYPDRSLEVSQAALTNFQAAKKAIIDGDRTTGGNLNDQLRQWTEKPENHALVKSEKTQQLVSDSLEIYQPDLPPVKPPKSQDSIEEILASISPGEHQQNFKQPEESTSTEPPPPPKKDQSDNEGINIRVALKRLNQLNYAIGELSIAQNQQSLKSDRAHKISRQSRKQLRQIQEQLDNIRDEIDLKSRQQTHQQRKAKLSLPTEFDELEMETYSTLHLMLQTLSEQISNLENNLDTLDNFIVQSRLQIRQEKQLLSIAQDEILQARMTPLETVFDRLETMVQQLGNTYNKRVTLEVKGKNVLVDKAISEKLYDPLLHLVRNAFAHGIELSHQREAKGKPPQGKITIFAYRQGNRTIVEVSDDGKGIDWEQIRETAIRKEADVSDLSELIFSPGFSTSDQINELSGRGFGLDVVRNQIHGVKGTVSVKSEIDRGTTFTLQLPLNLTTARLLICEAGGLFYALLSQKVYRMLLPQPEQVENQRLQWNEDGETQLLPIIPFRDIVNPEDTPINYRKTIPLTPFPLQQRESVNPILVVKTPDQPLCLEFDRILVEQELVIKTLPSGPSLPDYIQGYTVLADGSLSLVIDPEAILSTNLTPKPVTLQKQLSPVLETPSPTPQKHTTLLVIEDSLFQRRSIVETLETAGYSVLQAGDGKSAIALLNQHPEISIILCDIEMPQMNGFEFLGYCRQTQQLTQKTVIMLTSRRSEKHRNLALELGATAYLTKPCNDRTLLETINHYEH